MSEHEIVTAASAQIVALTESLAAAEARAAKAEHDVAELRALLSRLKTSMAEQVNDPMEGGADGR